ncbi:MAG: DNA repair protein RadC [Psychrobium sp.]|nr:DNA repair protein RadC [Psychrobium sp.]
MSIKDWPNSLQPREMLLHHGANSLSDAQLLAIFLRTGSKGFSAVDLANHLLVAFGGLSPLLKASQQEFCQHLGLGPAKYAQLQAVLEMSKRHYQQQLQAPLALTSSKATADYLIATLRDLPYEAFMVLYLDNQHQLITSEELFRGTINSANVYPREIVRQVIKHNAAAIILSHNHPSGISEPSQADRRITERIKAALALIDVTVLDHFIIGKNRPYSFADHGLL